MFMGSAMKRSRNKGNIGGDNLKKVRLLRKYSQSQLATEAQLMGLSIDKKAISLIENGKRYFLDYEIICFSKILNVPTYYLTDGVPANFSQNQTIKKNGNTESNG